jgi:predicted peptidase
MNTKIFLGCLIFVLAGCQSPAKEKPSNNGQLLRKDYVSAVDGDKRQYFLFLPSGYQKASQKKWPVIVFLHGNGERGNGRDDLDYVLMQGPLYEAWIQKRDLPLIIISPQLPMFGEDKKGLDYIDKRTRDKIPQRLNIGVPPINPQWPSDAPIQPAAPVTDKNEFLPKGISNGWELVDKDIEHMIQTVTSEYKGDVARIYLTGLSLGGNGTWRLANLHPQRFAAIMPVVGWEQPALMETIAKHKVPVWAFAGGRDQIVEKRFFYEGINELVRLGNNQVRFTVEEDMSHDVWKRVYHRDDVYEWFLQHVNQHINKTGEQ